MTRACLVYGCGDPVTTRGRCARHAAQVETSRSLGADRQVGQALYQSRRWRETRALVLGLRMWCECPMCSAGRLRVRSEVLHHVRPHGGDPAKFFDPANLEALSKSCHDRLTAARRLGERQSLQKIGAVLPGWRVLRVAGGSDQGPGVGKGATRG